MGKLSIVVVVVVVVVVVRSSNDRFDFVVLFLRFFGIYFFISNTERKNLALPFLACPSKDLYLRCSCV